MLQGTEDYGETGHSGQTGPDWGSASCLRPEHRSPQRTAARQKEAKKNPIKHSGNTTFDEIVRIARQMRHQSLARELSGSTKEILGMAQAVGYDADGCQPHDVLGDISSGALECPAR